jgi:dethiobiotin synthase
VARGYFVTGTDTGVGKTVASAALVHLLRRFGPVRYWKPVQTGIESDDDTATVARLAGCAADEVWAQGVRLERPVSPHLAARLAGTTIDAAKVAGLLPDDRSVRWIVEGAGGALVPLSDSEMMTDLIFHLALPVIVVARSTLGTINHTLLTIEALRRRSLDVAGVIMVGAANADNRHAIERYGRADVIGEMPRFDPLTPEALGAWARAELDAPGRLQEIVRGPIGARSRLVMPRRSGTRTPR